MKRLLPVIFFILFCFSNADAAGPYYVECGGAGTNSGTFANPWTSTASITGIATSEDVYFKTGSTCTGQSLTVTWGGTSEDPAVIGAYEGDGDFVMEGGETLPIFDGEGSFPVSNLSSIIDIQNSVSYVVVQDIQVLNSEGYAFRAASGTSYVTLQRTYMDEMWRNIFFKANYGTIDNNEFSHGGKYFPVGETRPVFVNVEGTTGVTVTNNYIHDHYGEGIGLGYQTIVKYNLVVDTWSVGIYLNGAWDCEVAYNTVMGTNDTIYEIVSGWHGHGIGLGTENNKSTNHDVEGNKIHHNVVINRLSGVRFWESNDSYNNYQIGVNYIYNNTLIDNYGNFTLSNVADDLDDAVQYIKNNISYAGHEDSADVIIYGSTLNNWDCDYNMWTSTPSQSVFQGANDQTGNPNFGKASWHDNIPDATAITMSDFTPSVNSGANGNGVDLGTNGDGNNYEDGWDTTGDIPPSAVSTLDMDTYGWSIGHAVLGLNIYDQYPTSQQAASGNPTTVEIGVTSSENANCNYEDTTCSGETYSTLADGAMSGGQAGTAHTQNVTQVPGGSTVWCVICQDSATSSVESNALEITVDVAASGGATPQPAPGTIMGGGNLTIVGGGNLLIH